MRCTAYSYLSPETRSTCNKPGRRIAEMFVAHPYAYHTGKGHPWNGCECHYSATIGISVLGNFRPTSCDGSEAFCSYQARKREMFPLLDSWGRHSRGYLQPAVLNVSIRPVTVGYSARQFHARVRTQSSCRPSTGTGGVKNRGRHIQLLQGSHTDIDTAHFHNLQT